MASFTVQDFLKEYDTQESFLGEQIARFDSLLGDYQTKIGELQARKSAALDGIVSYLLPQVDDASFKKLAVSVRAPNVANMYAEMTDDLARTRKRLSEIESNDEFLKRDALTDPKNGVIPSQIQEIQPMYDKAKSTVDKLNAMDRFTGLQQRGYETNNYPHRGMFRFLNSEYLQDWKAADKIIAAMGAASFIDVLSQYSESKQQVEAFGEELNEFQAQLDRINGMAQEHGELKDHAANIDGIYRDKAKQYIWNYLQNADGTSVQGLFQGQADLESTYKKLDGIDHQINYLQDLSGKVTEDRNKLVEKSSSLRDEAQRYKADPHRFRNKEFTEDQFGRRFDRDPARYDRMYDRYYNTGNTIYVFDNYNRMSFVENMLWWDVMTGGRIDGGFIPEVQQFHAQNPDYMYQRDPADQSGMNADNS